MPAVNYSILELDRNDIDGALAYAKDAIENGGLDEDEAEMLFMLQDDPTELFGKVNALLGIDDG